jgi:hypothetical protein
MQIKEFKVKNVNFLNSWDNLVDCRCCHCVLWHEKKEIFCLLRNLTSVARINEHVTNGRTGHSFAIIARRFNHSRINICIQQFKKKLQSEGLEFEVEISTTKSQTMAEFSVTVQEILELMSRFCALFTLDVTGSRWFACHLHICWSKEEFHFVEICPIKSFIQSIRIEIAEEREMNYCKSEWMKVNVQLHCSHQSDIFIGDRASHHPSGGSSGG